jgi:hypothetical protein
MDAISREDKKEIHPQKTVAERLGKIAYAGVDVGVQAELMIGVHKADPKNTARVEHEDTEGSQPTQGINGGIAVQRFTGVKGWGIFHVTA